MRLLVLVPLLLSFGLPTGLAEERAIQTAGDIGQYAVPATGLVVALVLDDLSPGSCSLVQSLAISLGATYALKYALDRQRPLGGGHSFPSGHTTAAFSGASFLHMRYGPRYGIPSYAAAALVGYSRIAADQHHVSDVLAGAAIGVLPNILLTKRMRRRVSVAPLMGRDTRGIRVAISF